MPNTYQQELIGSIVLIKNIIFKDGTKPQFDHAWCLGRPCLIIYSDNEFDYFLTISSNKKKLKSSSKWSISKRDLLYGNIHGDIGLYTIYKMPIAGHEIVSKLSFKAYKKIIEALKVYHHEDILDNVLIKAKQK